MDVPDNLDNFLRDLLKEEGGNVQLDDEDKAFIDRILTSITQGSKGVFVAIYGKTEKLSLRSGVGQRHRTHRPGPGRDRWFAGARHQAVHE